MELPKEIIEAIVRISKAFEKMSTTMENLEKREETKDLMRAAARSVTEPLREAMKLVNQPNLTKEDIVTVLTKVLEDGANR